MEDLDDYISVTLSNQNAPCVWIYSKDLSLKAAFTDSQDLICLAGGVLAVLFQWRHTARIWDLRVSSHDFPLGRLLSAKVEVDFLWVRSKHGSIPTAQYLGGCLTGKNLAEEPLKHFFKHPLLLGISCGEKSHYVCLEGRGYLAWLPNLSDHKVNITE